MTDNITHNRSSATAEPPRTGTEAFATGEGTQSDVRTIGYDSANLNRSRRSEPELDGTRQPIDAPHNRNNRKNRKNILHVGTWNVRTLKQTGKLHLLIKELEHQNLDVTGLSEVRWAGEGHFTYIDNSTVIFSGAQGGRNGVAVILRGKARNSLIGYNAVSDRIIVVKLKTKPTVTNIIQVYAPTAERPEEETDAFYEQLHTVLDTIKPREVCIMMGDLNAKVGEGADLDCGIGPYGLGTRNNNGQKLAELCQANNLILTNTLFCHHRRNRYTWISPDNNTRNQIDYIAINKQWASSIIDAKSRPGADCYTDHILTSAKLRIKAFRNKSNKLPLSFDVDRLRDDVDLRQKYAIDTENRFQVLCEAITEETTPNELWTSMENSYKDSAKEIVGFVKKKRRKCWIKEDTLQLVDERRHARAVSNTNRRRELHKQVQQQLRRDKREWLNKQCQEIDEFDRLRKAKQLYKQVNSLKTNTFKARQSSINDRNGKTLTEPEHVL